MKRNKPLELRLGGGEWRVERQQSNIMLWGTGMNPVPSKA